MGPIIPGLNEGWVPQGLTYSEKHGLFFISNYSAYEASCITVIDAGSGKLEKSLLLLDEDGEIESGHVGGLVVLGDSIFVSSIGRVLQYRLKDALPEKSVDAISPTKIIPTETRASFCTTYGDYLIVGEFARYSMLGKEFPTARNHHTKDRKGRKKYAWIEALPVEAITLEPFVLSIRQKVQGASFIGDRIFLSVSYGRKKESLLAIYSNPIGDKPHSNATAADGKRIPLWFIDELNHLVTIKLPPLSEGITPYEQELAILFESGANKFLDGGKKPIDRLVFVDVFSR